MVTQALADVEVSTYPVPQPASHRKNCYRVRECEFALVVSTVGMAVFEVDRMNLC